MYVAELTKGPNAVNDGLPIASAEADDPELFLNPSVPRSSILGVERWCHASKVRFPVHACHCVLEWRTCVNEKRTSLCIRR